MAVHIEVQYQDELNCRVTHGPSGVTLETDAPVDNHGRGRYFSPTDLVAAALGSCVLTVIAIDARRAGLELTGARASVDKQMSTTPPRRISRLAVCLTLPASLDSATRARFERVAHTCPVSASLSPDTVVELTFKYETTPPPTSESPTAPHRP